jgi:uncharacterized protein YndB with AHSA1/START domain
MGAKRFEYEWEGRIDGSPEQVWEAFTERGDSYLWPISYELREGGAETGLSQEGGVVAVYEPHRHFATVSGEGGYQNRLDYVLEPTDDGTTLRYHHQTGVDEEEWGAQREACYAHSDLYLHTLGAYVEHFGGRVAAYVNADGPETAATADDVPTLLAALGIPADAQVGDEVTLSPTGLDPLEGVLDFRSDTMVGVRTADAFLRVYGRGTWGWPPAVSLHLFADGIDAEAEQQAWQTWMDGVFADETDRTEGSQTSKDEVA